MATPNTNTDYSGESNDVSNQDNITAAQQNQQRETSARVLEGAGHVDASGSPTKHYDKTIDGFDFGYPRLRSAGETYFVSANSDDPQDDFIRAAQSNRTTDENDIKRRKIIVDPGAALGNLNGVVPSFTTIEGGTFDYIANTESEFDISGIGQDTCTVTNLGGSPETFTIALPGSPTRDFDTQAHGIGDFAVVDDGGTLVWLVLTARTDSTTYTAESPGAATVTTGSYTVMVLKRNITFIGSTFHNCVWVGNTYGTTFIDCVFEFDTVNRLGSVVGDAHLDVDDGRVWAMRMENNRFLTTDTAFTNHPKTSVPQSCFVYIEFAYDSAFQYNFFHSIGVEASAEYQFPMQTDLHTGATYPGKGGIALGNTIRGDGWDTTGSGRLDNYLNTLLGSYPATALHNTMNGTRF